ncbi:MAG TPA: hypothetical protein VD994_08440 [Prosthecobacter sp.]|nr:hypothetical protein [Prosthecobacter sp.]
MKRVLCMISLLLACQSAIANIDLIGPGVSAGTVQATKVPFKMTFTLSNIYKFVFSGIQAKGDTLGAPGSSGTNGNGGQFHLSATVNGPGYSSKVGKLEFRNVQDFNTAPTETIYIDPPDIIKATTTPITITIEWAGQGNAHKPNGTFAVLGEYQQAPPPPTGHLSFAIGDYLLTAAGTQPDGTATIIRD